MLTLRLYSLAHGNRGIRRRSVFLDLDKGGNIERRRERVRTCCVRGESNQQVKSKALRFILKSEERRGI